MSSKSPSDARSALTHRRPTRTGTTHDRSTGGDKNKTTKRVESASGPSGQSIPQVTTVTAHCDRYGKLNHKREDCKSNGTHPDFNKTGAWIGCSSYKKITEQLAASGMSHLHPMLRNNFRAGSSTMVGRESSIDTRAAQASPGSSRYGPSDSRISTRDATRDNTRDNRMSGVRFDPKDTKGIQPTMISLAHISCDCDAQDIDTTYRMCCITVNDSPSYSAATQFDTGSSNSPRLATESRKASARQAMLATSLAGTALSSPILGSVYFDLTFFNEVSQSHETINNIHAQIIDSCIAVITSRPVIRENHLVQKIPLYFDETTRSQPKENQAVRPVTLATTRARCVGAQPCDTCTPFVALGYDNTLCSLSRLRDRHPLVPQNQRRPPHVTPFADPTQLDMDNLIPKDALLDAIEDDNDIEWNIDPFEYPDRVDRESPEELVALIQFAGPPALQAALRTLCLEYSDIFAISVRHLPAKVQSMVLDIDHSKWEAPRNRLPQRSYSTEKQVAVRSTRC